MLNVLQKLETAWLNILRTVVVVASGLLLVAVVVFGLASLQGFGEGPDDALPVPSVSGEDILRQMTAPAAKAATEAPAEDAPAADPADANRAYFDRATVAIITFIAKHANGTEHADRDEVYAIIESRANSQGSPEMVAGYAKGFAEAIEAILDNPAVQKQAETSTAFAIVNRALDLYSAGFERQLEASRRALTEAQQAHLQDKADAASNLYLAMASFGLFLCIVFLSIFIRIERNLRHLEGCARESRSSLMT